jgi:pimeloyl-ACP methyl ester carboxylesterase
VRGDRPPVLLLHGFGASLGHWRHTLAAFQGEYPVYALDLLGFGGSSKAYTRLNSLIWAELVHDFWQTFLGQPTILMGNSLGSVIAMTAAACYPQLAQGLVWFNLPDSTVLMAPSSWLNRGLSPVLQLFCWLLSSPLIITPLLWVARTRPQLRQALRQAYVQQAAIDDELLQLVQQPACALGADRALRAMTRYGVDVPLRSKAASLLPHLTLPMLLIWGRQDRLVPVQLAQRCQDLNPLIQLVLLDQVGHCPQDEVPEQVNPLLHHWLEQQIQSGCNA